MKEKKTEGEITLLSNVKVYDMKEAIIASGYPMRTEIKQRGINEKDWKRACILASRASSEGHDNFLAGVVVSFDLSCSIKMWTEFERYHFAQIVSSQSTMHCLDRMDIKPTMVSYVDKKIVDRLIELQAKYAKTHKEEDRLKLLYSCPTGLKLTARITTNYRQLKTIYKQRHNHALPEWRAFCEELLDKLPMFESWCVMKEGRKKNG